MKIKNIDEHDNKLIEEVRYNPNVKGEYVIEESDSLNISEKKFIGMLSSLSIMTLLGSSEEAIDLNDFSFENIIGKMINNSKNKVENKGLNL